jgi:hypothetical protein
MSVCSEILTNKLKKECVVAKDTTMQVALLFCFFTAEERARSTKAVNKLFILNSCTAFEHLMTSFDACALSASFHS